MPSLPGSSHGLGSLLALIAPPDPSWAPAPLPMAGPSFPPSLGGGPAIPPGNTVLPAIRSTNNKGWDFLVRRIEDQRSELDLKEKELAGIQGTLATMV